MVVTVEVVYVDERLLVRTLNEGAPDNVADVVAHGDEEIDAIISLVLRSLRRQLVERIVAGAHKPDR